MHDDPGAIAIAPRLCDERVVRVGLLPERPAARREDLHGLPHAFETLVPGTAISQAYRPRALQWLAALIGSELREAELRRE